MRFSSNAGLARIRPVNYRYHGSLATSSTILLRELRIHHQGLQWAAKEASEAEEMSTGKKRHQLVCKKGISISCFRSEI